MGKLARKPPGRPETVPDAIFGALEELLRERSLNDLSVAQLAATAGISRQAFYNHFSAIEDVVCSAAVRANISASEIIRQSLSDPSHSIAGALTSGIKTWISRAAECPGLQRSFIGDVRHRPRARDNQRRQHLRATREIASVIEAGRSAGTIPEGADSCALAAVLLLGSERAMLLTLAGASSNGNDLNTLTAPITKLVLAGIGVGRKVIP